MLVITRRVGERLVLPDLKVILQVVAVRGKEVRLGVEAPRQVHVVRAELIRPQRVPAPGPRTNCP